MYKPSTNIQNVSGRPNFATYEEAKKSFPLMVRMMEGSYRATRPLFPALAEWMGRCFVALLRPAMALRSILYRHSSLERLGQTRLPVFRLVLLLVVAYVLLHKDLRLSFNLQAPVQQHLSAPPGSPPSPPVQESALALPMAGLGTASLPQGIDREAALAYIQRFERSAVEEMHRFGIPASLLMAQALLESQAGQAEAARSANNHFGIACTAGEAQCQRIGGQHYRRFPTAWDSWRAHSLQLAQAPYSALADAGMDGQRWAEGLERLGYSQRPDYARQLLALVRQFQLQRLDNL